jgi:hypothetical protein
MFLLVTSPANESRSDELDLRLRQRDLTLVPISWRTALISQQLFEEIRNGACHVSLFDLCM